MGEYKVERSMLVDAPIERIWQELVDVGRWPDWKPFINSTSGSIGQPALGSKFRMNIYIKGPIPVPVNVTVIQSREPNYIAWTGGIPKTAVSIHSFILEQEAGLTRVISREEFSGALVGLMLKFMPPADFEALHDKWLEAIKQRVER